jgi:hypothetical protein
LVVNNVIFRIFAVGDSSDWPLNDKSKSLSLLPLTYQ